MGKKWTVNEHWTLISSSKHCGTIGSNSHNTHSLTLNSLSISRVNLFIHSNFIQFTWSCTLVVGWLTTITRTFSWIRFKIPSFTHSFLSFPSFSFEKKSLFGPKSSQETMNRVERERIYFFLNSLNSDSLDFPLWSRSEQWINWLFNWTFTLFFRKFHSSPLSL